MLLRAERGCLLLADISGYTAYLAWSELEHAQDVLADLVETVLGALRRKEDAVAGLERWKTRHADAAAHLEPADVLVDSMRGRFTTWTRIRINLQHVPVDLRPVQEPLDPDEKTFPNS